VTWKAIQSRKPIVIPIHEYPTPRILPFLKNEGIQLTVSIPLIMKGMAIGAMTLATQTICHLEQREIRVLESIGNQIGLALENAKLFSTVAKAKSEWEATFDAVTDLITIRDKDFRIIRANKAAFKRYGLTPGEMIGKKCFEAFHHNPRPCEGCYILETLSTQKAVSGERKSNYLNGFFRYYTFPVYDELGKVIAVVDLEREITEERRLEMEKEVANNINKILASSLDVRQVMKAVYSELKRVLDSDKMTITLLSEKEEGLQYFALEKDYESIGPIRNVILPKEGTVFEKAMDNRYPAIVNDIAPKDSWINERLFEEGIRSMLVFPLEYKGKIIGTVNFDSRHTNHFSENHVRFFRQVILGLTISIENALLLDEIKASEEKYRTVVEGALDGVCVIGENFQVKYLNERLAEILGYTREELIEIDFRNLLDEEGKKLVNDRETHRLRGEEFPLRFEVNGLRKDGGIRQLEIGFTLMKGSQESLNTIAFVKDMTERKRMEEQLIQTEKLRALGQMTSGVAHDFNNALAAILGNTQLLLFTVKDQEVKEALQIIEKVAMDSAQTVRRLQDFTRAKVHRELFKLDINTIVKDAIHITKPKWKDESQRKELRIELVSNFGEIRPVSGIASELREVITNIIFNAVEAMPGGGKIEIRTYYRMGKVYIQISDTGIGMIEEVKKKIFEPFFTTKPFSNTGLGLSMSYGIINRLGGEIDVESQFGKGTTFTIILPAGGEGKEEPPSPPLVENGKEGRILIIDDEITVRDVLSKILSQVKHQVNVAKNGEEGIRLIKEKEFDLVLTDLGMPGISGWEVCKTVKRMYPHLPVGMITGWGMELDQAKVEETGIDFFISKPFDFNHILKVVAETMVLKKRRLFS
jgi:PAS domain S-box-containing protein